jgi:serine/threonine-protein kinase
MSSHSRESAHHRHEATAWVKPAMLTPFDEELEVGSQFAGRFQIMGIVGRGSMGVVYQARHELMGRLVAIKMLRGRLQVDERSVKRFEREARAASRMDHPNLITVHDFGLTENRQPYLVMDYVQGVTLYEIQRRQTSISPYRAVRIFTQVCDALHHAHLQGVIHRDLKPSNIMLVNRDGESDFVKVFDLGIAKIAWGEEEDEEPLTNTGEVCGSPIYLSPEQCTHQALDARTDIYSLGVVMYELLTGVPPLIGETVYDTIYMHVHEIPRPFAEVRPDLQISPRIERIVMKALQKNPDERYQSMQELKWELQAALQASDPHLRVMAPGQPPRKRPPLDDPAQNLQAYLQKQAAALPAPSGPVTRPAAANAASAGAAPAAAASAAYGSQAAMPAAAPPAVPAQPSSPSSSMPHVAPPSRPPSSADALRSIEPPPRQGVSATQIAIISSAVSVFVTLACLGAFWMFNSQHAQTPATSMPASGQAPNQQPVSTLEPPVATATAPLPAAEQPFKSAFRRTAPSRIERRLHSQPAAVRAQGANRHAQLAARPPVPSPNPIPAVTPKAASVPPYKPATMPAVPPSTQAPPAAPSQPQKNWFFSLFQPGQTGGAQPVARGQHKKAPEAARVAAAQPNKSTQNQAQPNQPQAIQPRIDPSVMQPAGQEQPPVQPQQAQQPPQWQQMARQHGQPVRQMAPVARPNMQPPRQMAAVPPQQWQQPMQPPQQWQQPAQMPQQMQQPPQPQMQPQAAQDGPPNEAIDANNQGVRLMQCDPAQAINKFRVALNIYPNYRNAKKNLGKAYHNLANRCREAGDVAGADTNYRISIQVLTSNFGAGDEAARTAREDYDNFRQQQKR